MQYNNANENMIKDLKVDKQHGSCMYNDEAHVYWDQEDNLKYVSVTTLIHHYCQEFDEDFWSSYKALQELAQDVFHLVKGKLLATEKFDMNLVKQLEVDENQFYMVKQRYIDDWEDNKNKACERGTAIHLKKELSFYGHEHQPAPYFSIGDGFLCEKDHYELDAEKGIYPEYLVAKKTQDNILRIAGQIDLLIKDGDDLYIADFKTNKKLDFKSYYNPVTKKAKMMKYPLNHLMDCNMNHYTLQLSLYAYLLQLVNPNFEIKELRIIHYDHDGKETHHKLEYKKDDVERMLKHYKQYLVLKERKDNRKPIEY